MLARLGGLLHAAYDAGRYAERFADFHHAGGMLLGQIDFHAMAHVEHLVHLLPLRAALLLDECEQRGDGEEIVLNDMKPLGRNSRCG